MLRLLRIDSQYAAMMRRLIVSDTIHWLRDFYVEHVSDTRQYLTLSSSSGDRLATPLRVVRRRWNAEEICIQNAARRGSLSVNVA